MLVLISVNGVALQPSLSKSGLETALEEGDRQHWTGCEPEEQIKKIMGQRNSKKSPIRKPKSSYNVSRLFEYRFFLGT